MDKAWESLVRYKLLKDKLRELKTTVWSELAPSEEVDESIRAAEEELNDLKSWIDSKYEEIKIWD